MYYSLPPLGIQFLNKFGPKINFISKQNQYKYSILFLTYISYCLYHLSRRPFTIVKSVLAPNCSDLIPPPELIINETNIDTWCAWEPFNVHNPKYLFGILDSCYLFSYAIFMFLSGFLAERIHLRYFLSFGMIFCGIFTYMFGLAYYYEIHSIYYFVILQIVTGFFQTSGWPAVISAVGHWCPKSSRGITFGIWNSHTNLGNMLGALVSSLYVEYNWGLSFIIPGFIIGLFGFILFLFLVPYPEEVGLESINKKSKRKSSRNSNHEITNGSNFCEPSNLTQRRNEEEQSLSESDPLIDNHSLTESKIDAISFSKAVFIPGVLEFSFCLFFCKLISYTFLYWLPMYFKNTTSFSSEQSALLSMVFDFGGIIGAILIGIMSDYSGSSGICCIIMFILTIPMMVLFINFSNLSLSVNFILQIFLGCLVNGPYSLITTSVAANLGSKVSSKKALATVSAIIDGTGSIGAAIGPLVAGFISNYSWNYVFYIIIISDILAMLLLTRIGIKEFKKLRIFS